MKEPNIPIKEPKILQDFKKFILRGNVVDLAVAVVIGAAFSNLVSAFSKDFINPLIDTFLVNANIFNYKLHIWHTHSYLSVGHFLSQLVQFLITAAVIFFFVVKPLNKLMELTRKKEPTPDPTTKKCPACISEIPLDAKRCMYCTTIFKSA